MTLRRWPVLRWVIATLTAVLTAVLIGVPTGIIETPWYHRMTPVLWWNYPVWAVTAVLSGLVWATYVRTPDSSAAPSRFNLGGGLVSLLAVGCPVCNKVVVLAVGVSGALSVWAPLQPVLAVLSLVLLVWALRRRLTGEQRCSLPAATATGPAAAQERSGASGSQ